MALVDLKKLLEKENRLFLFLIIWLIIGFTFLQFNIEFQIFGFIFNGIIIYYPLLIICIVLFLIAFFLQADIKKLTRNTILRGTILLIIVAVIFYLLGEEILFLIGVVTFIVSFIFYIFITSVFTMYYIYRYGISIDNKFYKMPAPVAFLWRWIMFLAGIIAAIALILFIGAVSIGATDLTALLKIGRYEIRLHEFVKLVPNIIIGVIISLTLISIVAIILTKNHAFNAWLGLFFLFSSLYASVLMVNAFLGGEVANVSPILDNPITYALIFIFELFIILYTISALIGTKADIILDLKVFKPIKADGILIFLILCKVAYEFGDFYLADNKVGGINAVLLKNISVFFLFIPLMIIMGLFGIISYSKIKQERKEEKLEKKAKKARDKERKKRIKQREKEQKKMEKQRKK
ncbi:MAG: hypothetical protein EU535_04710 [Promethearchaeota archaeon]|nr:MAG: hypothetical protein EU535_04710 [Candidatus Lokiarchaeota archaeon]